MLRWYGRHYILLDPIVALVGGVAFYLLVDRVLGHQALQDALKMNRPSLYSTLTQVGASLLGFILTAVPILILFGERTSMARLRAYGRFSPLYQAYFQAMLALACLTLAGFVAILADTDVAPRSLVTFAMVSLVLLCVLRVFRCVKILQALIAIESGTRRGPAPTQAN